MIGGVVVRIGVPILLYFLQSFFFPALIGGFVYPQLLLCWLLSWGLLADSREGFFMGLYCGFLADISSPLFFGFFTLLGGFLGWFSGQVREKVYHDTILLPLAFILGGTVALQVVILITLFWTHFSFFMLGSWVLTLLEQVLWNVAFVLPIYGLAVKFWNTFCR